MYNREWHVIIEHPGLAETFEAYLNNDFDQAGPLQAEERALRIAEPLPMLFVPGMAEVERGAMPEPETVEAKTFKFTRQRPLTVQPLLTPDNYAEHVLSVIRGAKKSLYFQNQYIHRGKQVSDIFEGLLEALLDKAGTIDVRIILRKLPGDRDMVESLIDMGFQDSQIRLQPNCHTKGIIADSETVVVGSHNWSSDGTTRNRDASLIFFDADIAKYFERAFLHDWERRAKSVVTSRTEMPRVAAGGARGVKPPAGFRSVPFNSYFDGIVAAD